MNKKLPRGQYETRDMPIMYLYPFPAMDMKKWKLKITGLVDKEVSLSLAELKKLGTCEYTKDIHCVTTWSKLGVKWRGIPLKKILDYIKPKNDWRFLIQHSVDGYTTNIPRKDIEGEEVFIAYEMDGKPISREHGYIRIIIPHLYGWKSAKYLTTLEFAKSDKPGFWEERGYHNHGRVDQEERVWGD